MAKVKITGHASGSGVVTVTAPNTSTDRTITLPDATATLATKENFLSTGIDDNASAVKLTVSDSGILINGAVTSAVIKEVDAGNVGFGVTPETGWRSSAVGLDIGDGGAIAGYDGASGAMQILSNSYWNTSGGSGWKYKNSSYPATLLNCDGEFVFKTAGNGTADNAITWTTPLEIKADGRGLSQFTAKAWINFNGTGTIAIRDSHNFSSISDQGTGNYQAHMDVDCASADYAVGSSAGISGNYTAIKTTPTNAGTITLDTMRVNSITWMDAEHVMAIVFGD